MKGTGIALLSLAALVGAARGAPGDLDYSTPAGRSEEGMPLGNGRMGSLVWTTPSALRFQINRDDVFAEDASSVSFPRADSDYTSGCGYVDIHVVQAGPDVFSGPLFRQHLSISDGLMSVDGCGVTARLLAWNRRDVFAVEIDDERPEPEAVNVDLRMLRYATPCVPRSNYRLTLEHAAVYPDAEHTAASRLDIRDGRILLTQRFSEKAFYDSSAVAIGVVGRLARARYLDESTVQLSVAPARGRFLVLIASAAASDRARDPGALALAELGPAEAAGFERLLADNRDWWTSFWSRGFVRLRSADGQAGFVQANYDYYLYLMAASSRGMYPPRFGGMLWYTDGDMRRWGSQYWWANTSAYYDGLMPANRMGLMEPLFSMYSGMYQSCALAARQQWGSEGIWIPETVFFDGLERLPDGIASELRDLMLVRKPYERRSAAFQAFAEVRNRHHSRWNFQGNGHWEDGHYVVPNKGHGIFGHTTHILGVGARIAALYWLRYEDTMDRAWLRDRAYPMLKGAAEFYRHFPNFAKGPDGLYHLRHVNNGEQQWDSTDTVYEERCLHLIFPLAVRASRILGADSGDREAWAEIDAHLPPAPARDYRGSLPMAFVGRGPGAIAPLGEDRAWKARFLGFDRLGGFVDTAGSGGARIFRNRLRLREGPGAIDAEHLGSLTAVLHAALLRDLSGPGEDPVLKLFTDWPRDWDAEFKLLAPGAFVVSAAQHGGRVAYVELLSNAGSPAALANPWPGERVRIGRNGAPSGLVGGAVLRFPTHGGERIRLSPAAP